MCKKPVAGGWNTAIGGQGQLGCMRPVCHRSSSELQISIHTMLKDAARCPGRACLNRSCLEGTVVSQLVPMVQSGVKARAKAELCYRLLSCPGSAAASAAEQLGADPAAEQLVKPAAEGAARQHTAAAAAAISSRAATKGDSLQQQQQQQQQTKRPYMYCIVQYTVNKFA